MQYNRYKQGLLALILLVFLCMQGVHLRAQQYGNFPFQASFLDKKVPPGVVRPDPNNNSSSFEDYGLQLTPPQDGQFGAIYLNNHRFKSELGIFIEFEFMVYDGSGGDGFCVYFFNANEPNPHIGARGAGLGYTYNRSVNNDDHRDKRAIGLNGAYMGIGFDSFGNFGTMRWQGEARVQGIPYSFYSKSGFAANGYKSNNAVVIRGGKRTTPVTSGGVTVPGMGVGYVGYPVLVNQRTVVDSGFVLANSSTDPKYVVNNQLKAKQFFSIRGGKVFERPTDQGYRKAFIEIYPNGANPTTNPDDVGFLISVMIQNEQSRDTIIYDYNYKVKTYYYENAYNNRDGDNDPGTIFDGHTITPKILSIALPLELKIGLAASTGKKNDRHVIKNLGIRLPRSAEAHDDYLEDKYAGIPSVEFKPLLNDLAYNGVIERYQTPKPENLDPQSFRFIDDNGNQLQGQLTTEDGTWIYTAGTDYTTSKVAFVPKSSTYKGEPRARYIIKGKNDGIGPYHDDAFYSVPVVMGVNIIENPNPTVNTITNKMITPILK